MFTQAREGCVSSPRNDGVVVIGCIFVIIWTCMGRIQLEVTFWCFGIVEADGINDFPV